MGGAQPRIASDLLHRYAVVRFEPDAVVIHNADDGDRHLETAGGDGSDPVERSVRRRVEYVATLYRSNALRLVFGNDTRFNVQGGASTF